VFLQSWTSLLLFRGFMARYFIHLLAMLEIFFVGHANLTQKEVKRVGPYVRNVP
jgi:hypothetical protein